MSDKNNINIYLPIAHTDTIYLIHKNYISIPVISDGIKEFKKWVLLIIGLNNNRFPH